MKTWRLIHSGHLSGPANMAIDEAILRGVAQGGQPTLRFYGWEPPAISVGVFQDLENEIDLVMCKSLGIDVVRRPTGGRAVLHDVEVTYSLILPEESGIIPKGITESYRAVSEGIVRGLASLGLDAKMVSLRRKGDKAPSTQAPRSGRYVITVEAPDQGSASAACFDSPSWYEVTVGGKKIVGSAQMRRMGVLLQHGSIPLELDAEKFFACLKFPSRESRKRAKAAFLARATSVREELGRDVSFIEVSEAIAQGLKEALGITFVEGELTPFELETAERLFAKYAHLDWPQRQRKGSQTA
ncbi:MAG TPA: lipoate--protein ligase family protein [Limnochordia bacterium]|nr:lipoate--protein ligase family protein [Limnochordia bacterium]